jgi:radical SAM protein with 4Fe4S-binding SPASM domain
VIDQGVRTRTAAPRRASRNPASQSSDTNVVPPLESWIERAAAFDPASGRLSGARANDLPLLESPPFRLPAGTMLHACVFFHNESDCGMQLTLRSRMGSVAQRSISGRGELALGISHVTHRAATFTLCLSGFQAGAALPVSTRLLGLSCRVAVSPAHSGQGSPGSTVMPHWNWQQRSLHRLCARSRWLNSVVAAFELHAGREEVVSLPQYMAICPTGQCNASCGFCSVTTNRTGIVKKQLPFEAIDALISPVLGTLRLFGLEGNGEPTLYDHFDDLLFRVTAGGASIYLITNGERLTREQIGLLLASPVDAVNFSLNAATARTHREIMKLKGWPEVIENIARLVRWRGPSRSPLVSVSLVVTRQNAHEVQRFLHFCEWELCVDRILVRPLSEIANDSGAVEDLRDLVPYESQINDLFDSVAEYLDLVPRRAQIVIDPAAFRAFVSDPPRRPQHPPGFENFLLAPRREGWVAAVPDASITWDGLSRLSIRSSAEPAGNRPPRVIARSVAVPIPADTQRVLRCRLRVRTGNVCVRIVDLDGAHVQTSSFTRAASEVTDDRIELMVPPGPARPVFIELVGEHGPIGAALDLGMTLTPKAETKTATLLPHPSRWQIDTPGTDVQWSASTLSIVAQAPAGRYLYRSYHVSADNAERVEFAVTVDVTRGSLGIGVLNGDGSRWLATERFTDADGPRMIGFDADGSGGFQVVLYPLTDDPLTATADWGELLGPPPRHNDRAFDPDELVLPVPDEWVRDSDHATIRWDGAAVAVSSAPCGKVYLLRSPRFPCPALRGVRSAVHFHATVLSGRLGVGFLGGGSETFVGTESFGIGEHEVSMRIDPLGECSLMAVVYSDSGEALDATIEWRSSLSAHAHDGSRQWRGGSFDPRDGFIASAGIADAPLGGPAPPATSGSTSMSPRWHPERVTTTIDIGDPSWRGRLVRAHREGGVLRVLDKLLGVGCRLLVPARPRTRSIADALRRLAGKGVNVLLARRQGSTPVYCQKPWTDLNNFTVDGRMDVCCIATGPSQERYALGNIFTQDFQQVWNGERMKEFRRTVNTPSKLPPCARCPMANNYTPPF